MLRQLFGLLVQAHYRTTPSDLHRLLDAPNLRVHAALIDGQVVGATLVALEGGLTEAQCAAIAEGKGRIRGHALPDTLISHSGRTAAGELSMVRSVRIVVHPALRRRGIARLLVEHVHRVYEPDLFGTLFGATPELLRFRREVGYEVVRLGASRGARTGEPSVVMLRPVSPRARSLVEGLREDLARDLPLQLALHGFSSSEADDGLDDELAATLAEGLPDAVPLERGARDAAVKSYAFGSRPFESAPAAVKAWVEEHRARLDELPPEEREVITARVLDQQAWLTVARRAGFDTVPPAMRALRRGVRHLW